MTACREQQSFADTLANVLRRFEREGGDLGNLARRIGQERRDLKRWADGTAMPAHVLIALLHELPRHLADALIAATGLRLVAVDPDASASALAASAATAGFSADVAQRMADGEWCPRDRAATKEHAARVIAQLQAVAGE